MKNMNFILRSVQQKTGEYDVFLGGCIFGSSGPSLRPEAVVISPESHSGSSDTKASCFL